VCAYALLQQVKIDHTMIVEAEETTELSVAGDVEARTSVTVRVPALNDHEVLDYLTVSTTRLELLIELELLIVLELVITPRASCLFSSHSLRVSRRFRFSQSLATLT
jgi:hypothetical protein